MITLILIVLNAMCAGGNLAVHEITNDKRNGYMSVVNLAVAALLVWSLHDKL